MTAATAKIIAGTAIVFSAQAVCAQTPPAPATLPAAPLRLANATRAARGANPTSRVAQQQLAQAQARFAQAQAQQKLQVLFSSTAAASNAKVIQPPPVHESFVTFINTVTVPLPIGRLPRLSLAAANEQLQAARAAYDAARLDLSSQVIAAFYDVLRKQALLAAAQDNLQIAQQQKSDTEKRYQAGDVPELEVLRATVPVSVAVAGVTQAQTNLTISQEALNALTGSPIDDPVTAEEMPPPAPRLLSLNEARQKAEAFSPNIRSAEANLRAQTLGRRVAGLSREPTYSLQGSDTRSNDQTSFSRLNSVQITLTVPLSDGGLARAQQREADANIAQAQAQLELARQTVRVAVSGAYLQAQTSLALIENARAARDTAVQTYDKTRTGYQAGLFPLTDVLNAQSVRTQAQIAYGQAVYDAAAAQANLNLLTGSFADEEPAL